MSSTKNNRIRRLTRRVEAKVGAARTIEMPTRRHRRMLILKKGDVQTEIFDNTHGRKDRRETEIKRLETCLGKRFTDKTTGGYYYETPGKKERMGKFAHKKDSRAQKAQAKQTSKQSKGKKKGG